MAKSYKGMLSYPTFLDRYRYLRVHANVGDDTFGYNRYLNQAFYSSDEWKRVRDDVIIRDEGCDLAIVDRPIHGPIVVHHIVPVTYDDILSGSLSVLDMDNLVCVSPRTHRALHYGDESGLYEEVLVRQPNDTCPWKGGRL